MDIGDDPQGDVVDGQLVVAGAQGAALLEPTYYPLDDVPLAVAGLVEPFLTRLVLPRRDHRLDVAPPQPVADAAVTVTLVPRHLGGPTPPSGPTRSPGTAQDLRERLRLVPLPRRHGDGQQDADTAAGQADLGAEAALRAAHP